MQLSGNPNALTTEELGQFSSRFVKSYNKIVGTDDDDGCWKVTMASAMPGSYNKTMEVALSWKETIPLS